MAVILARTNVAYSRPDWNTLRIDPQAPEAQGLYASVSVPLDRNLSTTTIPLADNTPYRWPVLYTNTLGIRGIPDPTVGSYATSGYRATLNPPPPSTSNGTLAVWVRLVGALAATRDIANLGSGNPALRTSSDLAFGLLFFWNSANQAVASSLILPLNEWALAVGVKTGGNATTYLFGPGFENNFTQADTNATKVIPNVGSGTTGGTSLTTAQFAEVAFWNRAFTPNEVRALWEPSTRWRRYYVPKTYWQLGDTPVADTQPFAAQPPRPKYIGLNAFSPQAQGLRDWLVSVDGALVQAWTSNKGMTNVSAVSSDQPSTVVQRQTDFNTGVLALDAPPSQPSDLGLVARSAKKADSDTLRAIQYWQPHLNLATLTDLTMVYWIYPLPSPYSDASYWGTRPGAVDPVLMQNNLLTYTTTQSFTLPSDPHIPGRWQMLTVARTLAGVNIWRDQTLVFTGASTGAALAALSDPWFQLGGVLSANGTANGVNALWADFRIYNREWKQPDVDYAYNVKTRWDYYADTSIKPWELPLTPTPPVTTFLSRLALMGAG